MRNRDTLKYVAALVVFGSNGVMASHIAMSSYEIVFTRTFIGALCLTVVFVSSRTKSTCWRNKRHFAFLLSSGMATCRPTRLSAGCVSQQIQAWFITPHADAARPRDRLRRSRACCPVHPARW